MVFVFFVFVMFGISDLCVFFLLLEEFFFWYYGDDFVSFEVVEDGEDSMLFVGFDF